MKRFWKLVIAILTAIQIGSSVYAQNPNSVQPKSRIEWIVEQQRKKARNLAPAEPHKFEQELYKYVGENPLNKYMGGIPGLHLRFGGLPSGSGLALGPEYFRPDLADGQMSFRASVVGSRKLWYKIETELRFPHLARRYLDLRLQGHRLDANSIDYFGSGPDSREEDDTEYRREENAFNVSLAFKPTRRYLSIGFFSGYWWFNIRPGESSFDDFSEKQISSNFASGLNQPTNYLRFPEWHFAVDIRR